MQTRSIALLPALLSGLAACASAPAPVAPSPPPAPPPEATAAPSAAPAAPAAPAVPVTPAKLAVLAEGWGLAVRAEGGPAVLYDRYFGALARVDRDGATPVQDGFAGVDRDADARVSMYGALGPKTALLSVARPGKPAALYLGGEAGWKPIGPASSKGWSRITYTLAAGADANGVIHGPGPVTVVPVPAAGPVHLDPGAAGARAIAPDLEVLSALGSPAGDVFVLGARRGGADAARAVAAHLAPGAATATVVDLPEAFPNARPGRVSVKLCGLHGGAMWAVRDAWETASASRAYAIVWKDGAWKAASAPSPDTTGVGLVSCAVTPDGALWTAFTEPKSDRTDSRVLRLAPDGAWSAVPLPAIAPLASKPTIKRPKGKKDGWEVGSAPLAGEPGIELGWMGVGANGELYLNGFRTAGGRRVAIDDAPFSEPRTIVLRAGDPPAGGPIAWEKLAGDAVARLAGAPAAAAKPAPAKPAPAKPAPAKPEPAKPAPAKPAPALVAATPSCTTPFVALYAVAPATPADYDFPLTREALRAKPALSHADFVEVDLGGKRTFGAMVPSVAFGNDLVALVQAKVAGSKPQLLCGVPDVLRTVPMDLPTKSGPRASSPPPTVEEWNGVGEVTVKGSSALGCETKRVREWVRVSCRGKSKAGATPVSVTVDRGASAAEVFTFAKGGVVSLVYPFAEGTDLAATFAFSDGPHVLTSAWPQGAPAPAVVGEMK